MSEKIVSYSEFVKDLTPEQFKGSTLLNGMLNVMYLQANELENMLFELYRRYNIDTAEGTHLDEIGVIVGTYRKEDESDTAYRARLKVGALYGGIPRIEAVRSFVKTISGSTNVGIYQNHPASFYVVADRTNVQLENSLDDMCASGVECVLGTFLCSEDDNDTYICSDDYDGDLPFVIDALELDVIEGHLIESSGSAIIDSYGHRIFVQCDASAGDG